MKHLISSTALFFAFSGAALAAPVDLSSWFVEQGPGAQAAANWMVSPDTHSVTQTVNSQVSVFYDGAASSQGKALSGKIKVNTSSDNDFVGFVLGMDSGEVDGNPPGSVDYWLVDWKQGDQNYVGVTGEKGLALSHVTGALPNESNFWGHTGVVSEKVVGTTLGNTGWSDFVEYTFKLVFTDTLIQVFVDGTKEIEYTSAQNGALFKDGGFGFYNYSQGDVTYAGIKENAATVPLPAGLPLMLAGLGVLGIARRAKKS